MAERKWNLERHEDSVNISNQIRVLEVGDHNSLTVTAHDLEHLQDGLDSVRNSVKSMVNRISRDTGRKYTTKVFRALTNDLAIGGIMVMRTE